MWLGKSWLEDMKKKGPTPEQKAEIKVEAEQHGAMALKGLSKLPDVNNAITYRGMALTDKEIKSKYVKGATVSDNVFLSTSNKPQTARNFAAENSTDGKIGIFFTIQVLKGKDVTMFSQAKSEGEILLLPNATFRVMDIQPPDKTDNFYQIRLIQTG